MNSKSLTCRKLDADMNNKKLARKKHDQNRMVPLYVVHLCTGGFTGLGI